MTLPILVDMDAVIAEWGGGFDDALDRYGAAADGIPRSHIQDNWNLHDGRTPAETKIITEIMAEPGFYAKLRPIRGAKTALKVALEQGVDVRIVTAPFVSNPTCASDKLEWVKRHYGSRWAQRVVLTNDKTLVRGAALVDDKPEITGCMTPTWRQVFFEQPYNLGLPGPRITQWRPGTLLSLAEHAEREGWGK